MWSQEDVILTKVQRLVENRGKASYFGTENKKARIVVEADFVYMEFRRFCLVVSEI